MKEKRSTLVILNIPVEIIWKKVKNINLRVYPPDGQVRMSVPHGIGESTVKTFILKKMEWIHSKQAMFQRQPLIAKKQMHTGEIHTLWGNSYRLHVIEQVSSPKVWLGVDKTLIMQIQPGMGRDQRQVLLEDWYRRQLKKVIPDFISHWEPVLGVHVKEWKVRKMKTRWGSCNIQAQRIWFNLELAKKPLKCLEYIVVHEMNHLLERYHNARFYRLMDSWMPDWRDYKELLNQIPDIQ
ncbi:M48 family metallopeptidase [Fidelibacter multiformis]|uniref:M48 family metallopeptidase n=1 Tax=Fidelibacter multiformis TaxID=3377529 RepID=UPI0037DC58FC